MDNTLSVLQLNTFISRTIERDGILRGISVYGEISAYKISGAHAYFTLKDKNAQIQCVCFNARKTYVPATEGESVIIKGSVDYYVKGGRLSLNVDTIQPIGKGLLHIKLEQLKLKLQSEGLFDEEHKKPIPRFAKRIAVVTSVTGAVIRDIITTVRKKNEIIDIDVFDVRVQGDAASSEIIRGLTLADGLGYDCIILARGGGSLEDLMPFNDERLARTIFALNTPIISAVGHETDYSISDFVADARAATPTAAAELAAYDAAYYKRLVAETAKRIGGYVFDKHKYACEKALNAIGSLSDKALRLVAKGDKKLVAVATRANERLAALYSAKENAYGIALTALSANNPVKLLKSGYFRVSANGGNLNSVKGVEEGARITVTGSDGRMDCTVDKITEFNIEEAVR